MKKNKLKLIVLALLCTLFSLNIGAQNIDFNFTDDTNTSYNLQDVRKLTFDVDTMSLHLWDGSVYSWNLSNIDHFDYDESSVNVDEFLEMANVLDVNIYPNPTNDKLNFSFQLPKQEIITIKIYDSQGKLLLENTEEKTEGKNLVHLDISSFSKGEYICHIVGEDNSIVKKIIKN